MAGRTLVTYDWLKNTFLSEDPGILGSRVPSNARKALTYDDILACTQSSGNKSIQITCSINNGSDYANNLNVIQRDLSLITTGPTYTRIELQDTTIDPMGGATYTLRLYKDDGTYDEVTDQNEFIISIDGTEAEVCNLPNNDGTTTQTSVVSGLLNTTASNRNKSVTVSYKVGSDTTLTDTLSLTQSYENTFGYYNGTYGENATWQTNKWLDDYSSGSKNTGLDPYIADDALVEFGNPTVARGKEVGNNPLSVLGETAVTASTRTNAENFNGSNSSDSDRNYHIAWRTSNDRTKNYYIYTESSISSSTSDCKLSVSDLRYNYISEEANKRNFYTSEVRTLSSVGTQYSKKDSNSLSYIGVNTYVTYRYVKPQHNYGLTAIKYAEYKDEEGNYPFRISGYPKLYKFLTLLTSDILSWGSNSVDGSYEYSFGSTDGTNFSITNSNYSYVVDDQWTIPGEYNSNVDNAEYQYLAEFFGLNQEICKRDENNNVVNDTSDALYLDTTTGTIYSESGDNRIPFNLNIISDYAEPWTKVAKTGTTIAYVNNSGAPTMFCPIDIPSVYYDTGAGPSDYKLSIYKIFYPETLTTWADIKNWVLTHKAYYPQDGTPETYTINDVGTFTLNSSSGGELKYTFTPSDSSLETETCILSAYANNVSLSLGRVYIPYSSYSTDKFSYYSNDTSEIVVTNVDKIVVKCTPDDGTTYADTTFEATNGTVTATNIPAGIVYFDVYIGYSCITVAITVTTGDKTLTGRIWDRDDTDPDYLDSGGKLFTWEELYQLTGNTKYQE